MSNLKRINGDKLRKILYSMEPDSLGRKRTLADFSIGRDELEDVVRTAVTKAFNEVLTKFFLLQEDNVENRREVNYAE